jgi:hypothetical protein
LSFNRVLFRAAEGIEAKPGGRHRVLWRSDEAVGFALPDRDGERMGHLNIGPENVIVLPYL